jgi:SP family sugar:H+ symporter-like MFS transporter
MLAFFTPFITAAIDYRYGYVFAACNLVAALLVWFFLMESAGRTLEEVDTMYLAGVPVTESHKWTSEQVGELIVSDNMYYDKGAKGISKRNEAARENAAQVENVNDHQNITVMDSDANVMGAAGARP